MARFDIKWDKLMMAEADQNVSARPIDAGAGVLSGVAIESKDAQNARLLGPGEGGPGRARPSAPTNGWKKLPTALAPLDGEMRQALLSIDLNLTSAVGRT